MDMSFTITFFRAFFAFLNPASVLPVFLAITDGATVQQQHQVTIKSTLYSLIMAAVVAMAGRQILSFLGVSVNDFRVAGGLPMDLNMINVDDTSAHSGTSAEQASFPGAEKVAFYPITFPTGIGPESIAILIIYSHQAKGMAGVVSYAVAFMAVLAKLGVSRYVGPGIASHLTGTVRSIMSRLMGMLLAAMTIGTITAGLEALLPGLG